MAGGLHCEEHEGGGVGLLVPVEPVVAGELELEERVVDAEDDVAHHEHQRAVQPDEGRDVRQPPEGVQEGERRQEDRQLSDYHRRCEEGEEDGDDGVQVGLDAAVPEPLGPVKQLVLRTREEGGLDAPVGVVDVGEDVLDQEGLLHQLLPPALQPRQLQQLLLDLPVQLHQLDLAQVRHVLPPLVTVPLRDEVADVDAFGRLAMLLLVPEELLDLQLQLLDDLLLLAGQPDCAELLLLQLDLVLLLPPQLPRDGHQSVREEDDHQEHAERIGGGHEDGSELLEVELVLEEEVDEEGDAQDGEYAVDDEVIDDCGLELVPGGELSSGLELLGDGEEQPGEHEDGVVDDLPDHAHGVVALERVVDIVGQEDYDDEAEQPGEVDQDLDCGGD